MGVCTVTQIVDPNNGQNLPARNDIATGERSVILQITPDDPAGYAAGGDSIDLTPFFDSVCYGAELLSCIDLPTAGYKWEINVNPAAAITATSTLMTSHYTTDPADPGGLNIPFIEPAPAAPLGAFVTTWRFRGR